MFDNFLILISNTVVNTTNVFNNIQISSNPINGMGQEIANSLFPNIPTLIGHLIATTILITVIWKFCYQPFKDAQNKKFAHIKKQIDSANDKLDAANKDSIKAKKSLQDARNNSLQIINDAKEKANNIKETNLNTVKEKSSQMLSDTEIEIKHNYKIAQQKIKKEIVDVAFLAAEKIINKEVKNKKNTQLVDEFLNSLK